MIDIATLPRDAASGAGTSLSSPAQRILRFIAAWAPRAETPIHPASLEPLFATEPPGALAGALSELCAKHLIRRCDGWHYVVEPIHATVGPDGER